MDAFDEAMFSFALRDAFEQVTMIEYYNSFYPPEEEHIVEIISECEDWCHANINIPFVRKPPENTDDGLPNCQHPRTSKNILK